MRTAAAGHVRLGLLLGVAALHAWLALQLLDMRRNASAAAPDPALVWLLLVPALQAESPPRLAPLRPQFGTSTRAGQRSMSQRSGSVPVGDAAPTASVPRSAIDWQASAEAVARSRAAGSSPPVRSFEHRYPSKPRSQRSSVFAEVPHRVGQTLRNADGEWVQWINPNCYVSLGSDALVLKDLHAMHKNMTICVKHLDEPAARGDLFDDMKREEPDDR